jgi:hypothetical protein
MRTHPDNGKHNRRRLVSAAIDRCREQIEAATDDDVKDAFAEALRGLEVILDQERHLAALERLHGEVSR